VRSLAVAALLLAGCSRSEAGGSIERIVVTGSSTVAPLLAEIGRRFEELHPLVRVDVQSGGSGRGIADAASGAAHIGLASRALAAGEEGLTAHLLAWDGVGLIVHADNPVEELSADQVRAIWRGQVDDWQELGGPPGEIVVVHKAEGRATLEVFLAHFGLANSEVVPDVVVGENQQAIKSVAGNERAVGYVSIGAAEVEAAGGAPIRLVTLDGIAASTENLAAGRFPIARPLNLLTRGEPAGAARELLDFALSAQVHDLVRAQSFVPVAR